MTGRSLLMTGGGVKCLFTEMIFHGKIEARVKSFAAHSKKRFIFSMPTLCLFFQHPLSEPPKNFDALPLALNNDRSLKRFDITC